MCSAHRALNESKHRSLTHSLALLCELLGDWKFTRQLWFSKTCALLLNCRVVLPALLFCGFILFFNFEGEVVLPVFRSKSYAAPSCYLKLNRNDSSLILTCVPANTITDRKRDTHLSNLRQILDLIINYDKHCCYWLVIIVDLWGFFKAQDLSCGCIYLFIAHIPFWVRKSNQII